MMILPTKLTPGFFYAMKSYYFDPNLGPNGLMLPTVKIGHTSVLWERLRKYRDAGVQYTFNRVWYGEHGQCQHLERMMLRANRSALLKHEFPGLGCKEVIRGDINVLCSQVDTMVANHFPSIDFTDINYDAARKSDCPYQLNPQKTVNKLANIKKTTCDELFAGLWTA